MDLTLKFIYTNPNAVRFTTTRTVIGGKWKGIIWWRLSRGLCRYSDLQRAIPQISKKMLTQQLKEMERDGIVVRKAFREVPPRVEYSLTTYDRSLEPIIDAICQWGAAHLETRETAA